MEIRLPAVLLGLGGLKGFHFGGFSTLALVDFFD